ncbi:MAG: hypothetical protein J5736_01170 [Bacilli bacterium]|nr:hypothetical protein [Bacilli bacterium]
MRLAIDADGNRVCIDDVERGETFFCQECGERLVQRRGEIKAHHFAHYPNTKCVDLWHYDETDWHSEMESLFPKEFQEIVLEKDGRKHRADVLIPNRRLVVEFQKDRLNADEFRSRNEFFKSFGYRVLWVFNEALNFQSKAITPFGKNNAIVRHWTRPSRVFRDFSLEKETNVEIWFQRQECDNAEEKAFFRIRHEDEIQGFHDLYCDHLYSQAELLAYLIEGKCVLDRGRIIDDLISIRRTDGGDYFFGCPKSENGFGLVFNCSGCPNCVALNTNNNPKVVACNARGEKMGLPGITTVIDLKHRLDGFVTEVVGTNANGEVVRIDAKPPRTPLRTLEQLWERYKPLKIMRCYNVKTQRFFQVFNPAWQKRTAGIVKGKMVNIYGKVFAGEVEIFGADDPVWIMSWFARPEKMN